MKHTLIYLVLLLAFTGCHNTDTVNDAGVPPPATMGFTIINIYPHDSTSFTEGLEWQDSSLYESTGNYGVSKLVKADLKTGKATQEVNLPKEFFGEGMTVLNGKLFQMTYKENKCFVYDFKSLKKIGEFSYDGEGWGMTNNGKQLIMDNGNNYLYFRDPDSFKITDSVGVFDNNGPLGDINELEWVEGFIYANVWEKNIIVKIDPKTGKVIAKADLSNLIDQYVPQTLSDKAISKGALPNGIAYNSITKSFYITGKLWPKLFEVKFN